MHPASGLVTALEPVMRACSGVWIAHGSGSADRETVDRHDHVRVPPGEESYHDAPRVAHRRAGEGLLLRLLQRRACGRLPRRPRAAAVPRRGLAITTGRSTRSSPKRCATKSIQTTRSFSFRTITSRSAPGMIRKRLPRATVIMFWHIPWPNAERMGICPVARRAAGWHARQQHCRAFTRSFTATTFWIPWTAYLEARIDREQNAVVMQGHAHVRCGLIRSRSSGPCAGLTRRQVRRIAALRCGATRVSRRTR